MAQGVPQRPCARQQALQYSSAPSCKDAANPQRPASMQHAERRSQLLPKASSPAWRFDQHTQTALVQVPQTPCDPQMCTLAAASASRLLSFSSSLAGSSTPLTGGKGGWQGQGGRFRAGWLAMQTGGHAALPLAWKSTSPLRTAIHN